MPFYRIQFCAEGEGRQTVSVAAPSAHDAEQQTRAHHPTIHSNTIDICRTDVELVDNPRSRQVFEPPERQFH
ncbi:hypothetical protein M0R72_10655 [Candidatus Pacearchaeota archaeon]|jgi:hypothetical protein|nr:hypothetical protein [Candidatus Pacearchaeota archaeon]